MKIRKKNCDKQVKYKMIKIPSRNNIYKKSCFLKKPLKLQLLHRGRKKSQNL